MATIKHRPLRRHEDPNVFTEVHRRQLLLGHAFKEGGYGDNLDPATFERMRSDWRRFRVELVNEYINELGRPGQRPWGFWQFDAEPRRLLRGSKNQALSTELWFGAPALTSHNPMDHPIVETEADYLERKGLFTEREQRYFEKLKRLGPLTERQMRDLWERGTAGNSDTQNSGGLIKRFRRKEKSKKRKG